MTKQEFQPDEKKEQNLQPTQSETEKLIRKEPSLTEEVQEAFRKL